jgi:hypothetical protein
MGFCGNDRNATSFRKNHHPADTPNTLVRARRSASAFFIQADY